VSDIKTGIDKGQPLFPRIGDFCFEPYLNSMAKEGYSLRNRVRLVRGGRDYFSLLHELIGKAERTIHLQYYIYTEDETGNRLRQALEDAAGRGVKVYLHVDGYASQKLSRQFVSGLRSAGVHFRRFGPFFRTRKFYFGRRMHHKVVVVDGIWSLIGGINVCDRYNDLPGSSAWLDMALFCEGEESLAVHRLCRDMWGPRAAAGAIDREKAEEYFSRIPEKEYHSVRVRRNDWVRRRNEISKSYLQMFLHAEKEIIIMCSYFLPGRVLRRVIRLASIKGVKIKTVLAGPSDVMIAKHAERYLYDWLLKNQVEIYEYQRTVLHAKVAVYDQRWVTVGSYNVNNISAYASLEVNFDVRHKPFAVETKKELENIIIRDCRRITAENYTSTTGFFRRLWQRFCYSFISTMLSLFTFYFKQEE